tara:strand:- start:18932 stop:19774 length:843 start_codon:yes stop_codon:yes gene_type:complete
MPEYLEKVSETAELRQGDIIRRFHDPVSHKEASWGFVINADCDLANKKHQGHISWLETISTKQYWMNYWAPLQLIKFSEKQGKQICDQVNSIIKKNKIKTDKLNHEKLTKWTSRQEPEEILASLGVSNSKLLNSIEAFKKSITQITDENALDILESCQKLVGQDISKNSTEFQKFIVKQEGFPDFFLVPNLPEGDARGYVVLFRRIHGSEESSIYRSLMEARVNDEPGAFHRIGRFSDGVRFQIVQKLSFLFTRIGSSKEFENDCEQVVEWTIESKKELS